MTLVSALDAMKSIDTRKCGECIILRSAATMVYSDRHGVVYRLTFKFEVTNKLTKLLPGC